MRTEKSIKSSEHIKILLQINLNVMFSIGIKSPTWFFF